MIPFVTHLVRIFTLMHKAKVDLNAAGMGKLENNLFSLSQTEHRKGHNISRNSYIPLTRQIADGGCTCVFVCGQRGWWTRRKLYHWGSARSD